MKYVMFEHAGSGNHGCEAIVRSTISMLGENEYYLESANPAEDNKFGIDELTNLIQTSNLSVSPNSIKGIYWRLQGKFDKSLDFDDRERIYRHRKLLINNAVALSIGGDNYCYAGIIGSMRDKLKAFHHYGMKTVLWGCSIGLEYMNTAVLDDLKSYDLITVRESLTKELLAEQSIYKAVISCADPAFTLQRQDVFWKNDSFSQYRVIGINVSDFMKYYNAYPDATYRNFVCLIDYLLKETDYMIAMIPHVRQLGNDDLVPINKIASKFKSDRILILDEDYNCMQIKDVISKCCMFIGCRTHATIAAYSTCVPTLVVGYSIKAKGICKDLFGSDKDLLVDVREFANDYDLLNKFLEFSNRETELREHLKKMIPEYVQNAYLAKTALDKLLVK